MTKLTTFETFHYIYLSISTPRTEPKRELFHNEQRMQVLVIKVLRTVYERLTAGGSTEQQAIQSGIWVAGINVGDRVLQLLKVVILARLLSPAAFGLLGIALLVIAALRQLSKLGFDEALIQHENENVDAYLNTAWVMKIGRGIAIAAIAVIAAPHLADFFGEPRAGPLISAVGICPLILGLQNPAVVYFQKDLNFHREFVYQVGGRLVDLIVAIAFALVFRSVWALVAGIISMNLVKFAISFVIHEYRPNVEFDYSYAKEMFGYGKWLFASSILVFLYGQGDDAFVGWFFTATSLGFYQMAYRFSNAPATEVTHVISRVAFPALSKVQNDVSRLREGYYRSVKVSTVVAFPMAAGIAVVAPQFVHTILGSQWTSMVPLMQILAVWGGFRAFGANIGPVFKSVGKPNVEFWIQLIKVAVIGLLIYPTAEMFGVIGVALVIVGSSFITHPIAIYLVLSIIEGDLSELLQLTFYPLIGSLGMASVVLAIDSFVFTNNGIIELVSLVIIGSITYPALMLIIDRSTPYEFTSIYHMLQNAV
ncbi:MULTISPECIES: lipopolysaccharide biosynthesis protein [unclassified Haloferax]|uniref:lipopolysaccharide biosynthesis protein n=1 Tax=unclassified Haloferax TaxID=2625095 RepID=UPI000B153C48|nr:MULTISPECIES: lipopolysaccharide biosynthesis protein [unclassified Haloferax]